MRVGYLQRKIRVQKAFCIMDSEDLLLDSLDKCGVAYRKNLKLCRAEFSKKAVHDLRTSIRRLLATLDVVAFFTSAGRTEKLSDRLKEQLDGFSDLRDTQVMLDKVSEEFSMFPELEPFRDYLKKREKQKRGRAEKHIEAIKPGGIRRRLRKIREAVEDLSDGELQGKLPQAVDEAYLTVLQRYGEIDPGQLVSIHRLRVAFKKFRYMVEAIHPCLPDFPEAFLTRMHDYQTQLGNVHDAQVLLETLTKFAEDRASYDPTPVRRFYEQSLADQLSECLKNKEEVLHFWRLTPLAALPWQKGQDKKR
jgi:CHAD domain-containing protein